MTQEKNRFTESLHVFVLTSFALAQPLLHRLAQKPVYLADQGIGLGALVMLALALCLLVPSLILLMEVLAGHTVLGGRDCMHAASVFCAMTLIAFPVLNRVPELPGMVEVLLAPAIGF